MTWRVDEPAMPSLCSSAPRLTPGASNGTMKQVKPVWPSTSPCTLANTKPTSAMPALVMNCLVPFSTHRSPSSTAVVCAASASEPEPGSVRQ